MAAQGQFSGKVALVTGAGSGIGEGIARAIAHAGARVCVMDLDGARAERVSQDINASNGVAFAAECDATLAPDVERLRDRMLQHFGRIDVLVNNAGINVDRSLKNLTVEDWDKVIQNDLNSYFYTVKAALPYFMQQKSGKIINISSVIGQMGNFGQGNYAAAKAGIVGFTKTAALELARSNVTVNAICPGFIATEMYEGIPDKAKEAVLARIPLGRVGTPQEVARAVRYLIVDGDYITGASLNINGGMYMQ
jgi:acetoacetyl-CoA reductase